MTTTGRNLGCGAAVAGLVLAGVVLGQTAPAGRTVRRENVVLDNPFPEKAELSPTLVSLNLADARHSEVVKELDQVLGAKHRINWWTGGSVPVTFACEKMPYLQALRSLEYVGGVALSTQARGVAGRIGPADAISPVWCVAGAFSFTVTEIKHEGATVTVFLQPDMEPKVKVEPMGMSAEVTEAKDDRGNVLRGLCGRPTADGIYLMLLDDGRRELGRRIAVLKGTVAYQLPGQRETVEIPDAAGAEAFSKTVEGVLIDKTVKMVDAKPQIVVRMTIVDGSGDQQRRLAMLSEAPCYFVDKDKLRIVARKTYWGSQGNGGCELGLILPADARYSTLCVEVPKEGAICEVPFEFRDLPLR